MNRREISWLLFSALAALSKGAATPHVCVGSVAVASFRLSVQPPASATPAWIPIRHVNNMPNGYRISYQPLDLPSNLSKDAKLALVMVPKAADGQLTVLEPRLVTASTEWAAPFAPKIVIVVFGPQGLDEKRLTNLVTRDENLTNALADYADQTADLEAGLQLAREMEQDADDDAQRPARAVTPAEQAIFSLVRALNPAVSSYDPLGAGRRAGPATMTGKGMEAFFENAGSLFPGGGALPMIKQFLMPDTEFRSVFGVPIESDGMTLCAQLAARTRNRLAYIWAYRLVNTNAPATTILKTAGVPISMRVGVPVRVDKAADGAPGWRLLDHVFDWTLIPQDEKAAAKMPIHVPVRVLADERALRVDLRNFSGGPGLYSIQGRWDWDVFKVAGTVNVHRFDELGSARLTPESQDKLIAATGPVDVELTGGDFLFLDHAAIHRPESAKLIDVALPADRSANLKMEIDTDALRPGPYMFLLSRIDGASADIPFRVLPPNPKIDRVRVNAGEPQQTVTLSGTGLDRITNMASDRADITLTAANEDGTRRAATIRLQAGVRAGDQLALTAKVNGLAGAVRLPIALQVAAALPKIDEAKASLPRDLGVALRDGEIPAGTWSSFAIKLSGVPADAAPVITFQCSEPNRTIQPAKFATLFISLDAGTVGQTGCTLQAIAEIESVGKSVAFPLGKVVRLPRIENLTLSDEKSADGYMGTLKGFDLETIEKTGWNAQSGMAVPEAPRPMVGEGAKQSLRITMPWPSPSPKAPLYVWLRGDTEARATKITQ
jgi:hypothetical protein